MTTIFSLYGPRKSLVALATVILEDDGVDQYEIHKDSVEDYAFITCHDDLALDTYEAIENAPGVTYSKEEE